jgi:quercetin dioxygenase-like cupin family protein
MREIRTFDIQYDEPATAWRVARPLVVEVAHGVLWLTIEGDAEDYWLDAGQSFLLPAGAKAWIGAGRGDVRLTVKHAGSVAAACSDAALACPRIESGTLTAKGRFAPRWRHAAA